MRLNNNELAEIYQNEKWMPICGHWFWDNNKGASLFCQQLGYKIGIVKQESIARQVPLPDDGFRIGECKTNDIWGQCTGGCNDHTIGGTHCSDCRSGAMAGLRIECSNGNHYRLHVLNRLTNRLSRRKRGMASNPLFIIPDFFFIFPINFAMARISQY